MNIKRYEYLIKRYNFKILIPKIKQTLEKKKILKILPEFDGWIIGDDTADQKVLEKGSQGNLKAIVKWGIGIDKIDVKSTKKLKIKFTNTPNMFGEEVSNVAICYLLGIATNCFIIDKKLRNNVWHKPSGTSLENKILGIIGFGDIGKKICKKALSLKMKIKVWDPKISSKVSNKKVKFLKKWPLGRKDCDYLIFSSSLNSKNNHMFNKKIFKNLKKGVSIINISRGELINELDLIKGLNKGIIKSAALDVFETEPLPNNSKLRKYQNCILGSHNSSNTIEAVDKVSIKSLQIMNKFLK